MTGLDTIDSGPVRSLTPTLQKPQRSRPSHSRTRSEGQAKLALLMSDRHGAQSADRQGRVMSTDLSQNY